jgi:hypothetical protein
VDYEVEENMSRVTTIVTALGLLAAGAVVGKPAAAAVPVAGYVGWDYSSVAGCPYLEWKLARHTDGTVTGIVYYSDMSGTSQANGTIDQAGHFQLTLTSAMGNGPVGTITGTKSADGAVTATLTGQGRANMHMHSNAVADISEPGLNEYHHPAGGH